MHTYHKPVCVGAAGCFSGKCAGGWGVPGGFVCRLHTATGRLTSAEGSVADSCCSVEPREELKKAWPQEASQTRIWQRGRALSFVSPPSTLSAWYSHRFSVTFIWCSTVDEPAPFSSHRRADGARSWLLMALIPHNFPLCWHISAITPLLLLSLLSFIYLFILSQSVTRFVCF